MADYTEAISIDTQALRKVGDSHDVVAQHISTARLAGDDIATAVGNFGPIMWRYREAMAQTLARREAALAEHEEKHRQASVALFGAADQFDAQEELNQFRTVNAARIVGD